MSPHCTSQEGRSATCSPASTAHDHDAAETSPPAPASPGRGTNSPLVTEGRPRCVHEFSKEQPTGSNSPPALQRWMAAKNGQAMANPTEDSCACGEPDPRSPKQLAAAADVPGALLPAGASSRVLLSAVRELADWNVLQPSADAQTVQRARRDPWGLAAADRLSSPERRQQRMQLFSGGATSSSNRHPQVHGAPAPQRWSDQSLRLHSFDTLENSIESPAQRDSCSLDGLSASHLEPLLVGAYGQRSSLDLLLESHRLSCLRLSSVPSGPSRSSLASQRTEDFATPCGTEHSLQADAAPAGDAAARHVCSVHNDSDAFGVDAFAFRDRHQRPGSMQQDLVPELRRHRHPTEPGEGFRPEERDDRRTRARLSLDSHASCPARSAKMALLQRIARTPTRRSFCGMRGANGHGGAPASRASTDVERRQDMQIGLMHRLSQARSHAVFGNGIASDSE